MNKRYIAVEADLYSQHDNKQFGMDSFEEFDVFEDAKAFADGCYHGVVYDVETAVKPGHELDHMVYMNWKHNWEYK